MSHEKQQNLPQVRRLILGWLSAVPVTRYVCTDCGFAESWVDDRYHSELKERYERENK